MTVTADAAEIFEQERPRLRALAYRMLGSVEDAEDVVQETFLRWHDAAQEEIISPVAWLTTVCTRLSIDALRAAYRKRESYVGPWLPEPLVTPFAADMADPVELADSLSLAFLLMLERLSPLERAAFLLHDVFDYNYREIADILGRSEAACRQLVSRARRHLRRKEARFPPAPQQAQALLGRFLAAARAGEIPELAGMLAAEAELWSDSGGEVAAARNVIRGAEPVARFLVGIARKGDDVTVYPALVNGTPGMLLTRANQVMATFTIALDAAGKIERLFITLSPSKLRRVRASSAGGGNG